MNARMKQEMERFFEMSGMIPDEQSKIIFEAGWTAMQLAINEALKEAGQ